jgi:hypothetical protein
MKIKTLKIRLLSVIVGIFLGGCGCYAADNAVKNNIQGVTENMETQHTIITPLLNQNLVEGQNVLWCSTLQLAWNELDTLAGGPIKMEAESPIVAALNQRTATKDEIDAASYLALAGIVGPELLAKTPSRKNLEARILRRIFVHCRKAHWQPTPIC